ncbi:MAG: hypothetical protein RIF36_12850 [Imperialibacter sp.]|uniref:hypothetical protein n=1 Tax=Imperialibacter sp. TaxID=2038411 RepID=UPI0032EB71AB
MEENYEKPLVLVGKMPIAKLYDHLSVELQEELNLKEGNHEMEFFTDINAVKFAHAIPGEPDKCVIVLEQGKYEVDIPFSFFLQCKAKRANMRYFTESDQKLHGDK